ncbi:MAG TPA: hypothetical protein VL588_07825 [Bdellovibrionota bacterium]|jgi:hypothetical protein|nr:hypothetical protein [Bdellovibrionota bacterium]
MRTVLALGALGLLVLPALAHGEGWEWTGPHGRVRARGYGYTKRLEHLEDGAGRLDAWGEFGLTNGEAWTFRATPWAWAMGPYTVGGDLAAARPFFDVKEAWAEFARTGWDARIGYQTFAWGRADGVNPVDLINPRDLTDLLDSEKLAVPAARVRLHPSSMEGWGLELVGGPTFRSSRLPAKLPSAAEGPVLFSPEDGRWLESLPSFVSAGGILTPLVYEMEPVSYPATPWGAVRLSKSGLGSWDLALTAFDGVEHEPRMAATQRGSTGSPTLPVTVEVHPSFHRQQSLGLDGSTVWEIAEGKDVGFRFEGAYVHRDNDRAEAAAAELRDQLLKDDYVHAVAGLDYNFPHKVVGTDLYVNLQYSFYERLAGPEQTPGVAGLPALPTALPWDREIILVMQNKFEQKFTLQNLVIWSHRRGDGLYRPSLAAEWSDTFTTTLGADLPFGSPLGFFGQYSENGRVALTAEWAF